STRINLCQPRICIGVSCEKSSTRTFCMSFSMKTVNDKKSICKKFRLTRQAIWSQCICEVIHDYFGSFRPACNNGQENIIAAFSSRDTVEPIAYAMGTPSTH
ncbi:hypothetical protein SERLA73DRAFT_38046, partial [Serpula lacrymans var. lacrymans S7.3]